MSLSLIIPTYNGAHKIVNLLDSLREQTLQPNEIIIVIDGSTDNTIEVLQNYKQFFTNLTIIEQENQGRACVRNNGALAAKNDLLLFIDDDMVASKNLIEKHFQHHTNYPKSICVGYQIDLEKNTNNDFGSFRNWLNNKWIKYTGKEKIEKIAYPYITASNFSISMLIFKNLGMFNNSLTDSEDYELAVVALDNQIPIYINFEALAYHDEVYNNSYKNYIIRQRQYFLSRENSDSLENSKNKVKYNKNKYKSFIFKIFANNFWIETLENNFWAFLPKFIKFKLYDIIITANSFYFPNNVKL